MTIAFRRAAALGLLLSVSAALQSAHAQGGEREASAVASTLDVEYNIYFGGITLGQLSIALRMEGGSYKAISTLRTSGVVDALWSAKIEASSNGIIENGQLKPVLYYASSQHDESNQQVTVKYPPGAAPTFFAEPAYKDPQRIVMKDEQKIHTLDPVSAMVSITTALGADGAKPCGIVLPVYDARRRYDVSLTLERNAKVDMDNGLYSGQVQVCRIAYKPLAGAPQRVLRNGNLPPVHAWVAPLQSKIDPSRRYMIPLRIWAESEIGIAAAVVSSIKLDGVKLTKLQ